MQLLRICIISLWLTAEAHAGPSHYNESAVESVSDPLLVTTSTGTFQGVATPLANHWLGVPYAQPPLGPWRFRPAQPLPSSAGLSAMVRDATQYGAPCIQTATWWTGFTPNQTSEDCLKLNIWVPRDAEAPSSGWPVLVYIHGGGNQHGSGVLPQYNGTYFTSEGVIAITINYRLGPLGLLAMPALREEDHTWNSTGGMNYLTDQIQALRWVKQEIKAFGGDPKAITIMGESAGSISVCSLLASPKAQGLFRAAVMQSGPCTGPWSPQDSDGGELAEAFMKSLDVSSLEGLRSLPAHDLLNAKEFLWFYPTVDGVVLPKTPKDIFNEGTLSLPAGASVLLGTNTADGLMAAPWRVAKDNLPTPTERGKFMFALENYFGGVSHTGLPQLYQHLGVVWEGPIKGWPHIISKVYSPEINASKAYIDINSDLCVSCPIKEMAADISHSGRKAYLYRYGWNPRYAGRAPHAAEVGMVFGFPEYTCADPSLCPKKVFSFDASLSERLRKRWGHFARTGKEPGFGWAQYTPDTEIHGGMHGEYLNISSTAELKLLRGFQDRRCAIWDHMDKTQSGAAARVNFCNSKPIPPRVKELASEIIPLDDEPETKETKQLDAAWDESKQMDAAWAQDDIVEEDWQNSGLTNWT